ncbi:MAG: hypothetical protein Q9207_007580 [Kuettlingeria erythrocarpa]
MNRPRHHRSNSQAPISSSPEQLKHLNRSGSNLASAFAASITRPFSFSTPESSSPPTMDPERRSSPVPRQLATWASYLPRGPATGIRSPDARVTLPNLDEIDTLQGQSDSFFETRLKNQDQFHNDGYAADPLLDPAKEETYSAYRSMYASMLLSWELPIASRKVLQYNRPVTAQAAQHNLGAPRERESLITIGRGTFGSPSQDPSELRLEIRNHCHGCDTVLPPGKDSKRCLNCSTKPAPTLCQLCHTIISGLSSPCLNCGHVLHLSCRSLLQQSESDDLNGECPTGCGCICVNHVVITLPTEAASTQRIPSISSTTLPFENEQESFGWRDVADDAEGGGDESDAWEDVAYESLARNLGGSRFLTPRPSQIWRGGETRKGSLGAASLSKLRRSGSG